MNTIQSLVYMYPCIDVSSYKYTTDPDASSFHFTNPPKDSDAGTRPDQLFGRGARGVRRSLPIPLVFFKLNACGGVKVPDGSLNSLFAPKEIKELEVAGRSNCEIFSHDFCFAPA